MREKLAKSTYSAFPLFIAVLVLALFGAYYYGHVSTQEEYFKGRNLRHLDLIATQINARIEELGRVLNNAPKKTETGREWYTVREYLTSAEFQHVDSIPEGSSQFRHLAGLDRQASSTTWLERSGDTTWLWFIDFDTARIPAWRGIMARYDLHRIVDPLLIENIFDELLLVNAQSDVVYQQGVLSIRVNRFDSLHDTKGSLISFSGHQNVTDVKEPVLAGTEYKLFYQPTILPVGAKDTIGLRVSDTSGWGLCGLVASDRILRESRELSYSVLILVIVLLILVSLSWPLLKFHYMGPQDRPTRVDVFFLIFAAVFGSAVLTFVVGDALNVYLRTWVGMDRELEEYADSIEANFRSELDDALPQLIEFRSSLRGAHGDVNLLAPSDTTPRLKYKNFDLVFRVDLHGMQIDKWTVKQKKTPPINVGDRQYFKDVVSHNTLHWRGKDTVDYSFAMEPHYSWTTGKFQLAISVSDLEGPRLAVLAMDALPVSLFRPVTVPGYAFCVIDESGKVLFHSREARNLRENLFDELDPDRQLRALVATRSAGHFNARYWGIDHRIYVKPVTGIPWFIVVFRDKTALRTINIEIFTSAMVLFLLYLIFPLLTFTVLCWKTRFSAPWAWPDYRKPEAYRQLSAMYSLMIVTLFLLLGIDEQLSHALVSVVATSVLALVLAYARLNDAIYKKCNGWNKKRLYSVTAALGIASVGLWAIGSHESASEHEFVWILPHLLLACFLFALGLCVMVAPESARFYEGITSSNFKRSYVHGALALLVLTSIYPAYLFFRVSHNVQAELLVKHAQLQVGRTLLSREKQIRTKYANINIGDSKEDSLRQFLDERRSVYVSFFFNSRYSRWERGDSCKALVRCRPEDAMRDWLFHILTAPYNEMSGEMRELLHEASSDNTAMWIGGEVAVSACRGALEQWTDTLGLNDHDSSLICHVAEVNGGCVYHVSTRVPALAQWDGPNVATLVILVVLLCPMYFVARYIARRLFLIDVMRKPPGIAIPIEAVPPCNLLVLDATESSGGIFTKDVTVHTIDLASASWEQILQKLSRVSKLSENAVIVIDHLESNMHDQAGNQEKLRLIEQLVHTYKRRVVLISSVDPMAGFAFDLPPKKGDDQTGSLEQSERWREVLGSFSTVYREDGGEQVAHEDPEASRSRYRRRWMVSSPEQRRVLTHVALGGYVSPANHEVVSTLLQRGLLCQTPELRVTSESFKRFLQSTGPLEEIKRAEPAGVRTGWSRWRLAFSLLLISVVLFLFLTQQEVLNTTMAFISAATALLPALFRLVGMLVPEKGGDAKAE